MRLSIALGKGVSFVEWTKKITTGRERWALKTVIRFWLPLSLLVYAQAGIGQGKAAYFLTAAGEEAMEGRITAALEAGGRGARGYLHRRRPVALTVNNALQQVLQRNPTIQAQQQDRVIAENLRLQSQAVFDPALNVSAAYTRSDFFERNEFIVRERGINVIADADARTLSPDGTITEQTSDSIGEEGETIPLTDTFGNVICITVSGELVNPELCALQTSTFGATEFASPDADPVEAWRFNVSAAQLFPWGTQLEVEFESTRQEKNFFPIDDLGLAQPLSVDDPIGRGSRFPWTSSFFAALNTPLPFSKNFGPYGSVPNVGVMLAEVGRRQADWAWEGVINATLRQVDDAFWELVRSILQLQITLNQRETLEALAESGARLYEARQITTYDRAQIDAQLAQIENREEVAWTAFLASSNRVVELLDYAGDVVILPERYSAALRQLVKVDESEAFATAKAARPELNVSRLGLESSRILLKNSQIQTRPDLNLTFSVNLSQTDRVLGYDSWEDSFSNVFDPDISDYFVGVSFRIPFGNREVKSQLAQARIRSAQARDEVQQTENAVAQELNTLFANAYSTQAQIVQTKTSLELAHTAFDKASQFRERGLITEFELLQKLNQLLAARSDYINALVDHQKIRAQVLAAEGVLAAQYVRKL